MSKKKKALQISALLTAVSGATLVAASGSAVNAAEIRTVDERCWDLLPMTPQEYRLNNCEFVEYGLIKSDSDTTSQNSVDTPDTGGGGGAGGPDPVDPYQP